MVIVALQLKTFPFPINSCELEILWIINFMFRFGLVLGAFNLIFLFSWGPWQR